MTQLRNMPTDRVVADAPVPVKRKRSARQSVPQLAENPPRYAGFKLIVETMVAVLLIVVAAPLMAALALLVKLTSPGPVFYSQVRLGRLGRPFRIYKLRTMAHECEMVTGPVWAAADDPRVTKIGRWLRDTHLDELPQLWNVIRGEMSLIGPRPERPEIAARVEQTLPEFRQRLLVRPGITGLAQMRMPADTNLHALRRKLAHDLYYVRNIGPVLDAWICLATILYFLGAAAKAASRQLIEQHSARATDQSLPAMTAPWMSITRQEVIDSPSFVSIDLPQETKRRAA